MAGDQTVNQPRREAVPAADSIDEADVVVLTAMHRRGVGFQRTALQPLSLAERLSRRVMATIFGPKSRVTCSAACR